MGGTASRRIVPVGATAASARPAACETMKLLGEATGTDGTSMDLEWVPCDGRESLESYRTFAIIELAQPRYVDCRWISESQSPAASWQSGRSVNRPTMASEMNCPQPNVHRVEQAGLRARRIAIHPAATGLKQFWEMHSAVCAGSRAAACAATRTRAFTT